MTLPDDPTLGLAALDPIARDPAWGDAVELWLRSEERLAVSVDAGGGQLASRGRFLELAARVWRDGRCGTAWRPLVDAGDLKSCVADAAQASLSGAAADVPAASACTAGPDPGPLSEQRARDGAHAMAAQVEGLAPYVVLAEEARTWLAIASTTGTRAAAWRPTRSVLVRAESPAGPIVDGWSASSFDAALETFDVRERLAGADAFREPGGPLDPALPIVLRPCVAAPLVAGLGWLLAGDVVERTPGLAKTLGRKIFPAALTLFDDPPPNAIDDEGRAAPTLTLVDSGRVVAFLHSAQTATSLSATPNGRSRRTRGIPVPGAVRLRVAAGTLALPDSRVELTARIETFVSMPRPGVVSIMAAGWEIRDGIRRGRVRVELDLPVLETFRRLRGVLDDAAAIAAVGCITPSLVLGPGGSTS